MKTSSSLTPVKQCSPIFFIPTILDTLRDNVALADIKACSLVCYDWSKIFGPFTWRNFVFTCRDYERLLGIPHMAQRFLARARTIKEVVIQGRFYLNPLVPFLDKHNKQLEHLAEMLQEQKKVRLVEQHQRLLLDGAESSSSSNYSNIGNDNVPPVPALLFQNQLTRLEYQEWGPIPANPYNTVGPNYLVMNELVKRNKNTLRSIECLLHTRSVSSFNEVHKPISHFLIELSQPLSCLTSLILKGPDVNLMVVTIFRIFATVPPQLQVLKVEHSVDTITPYRPYRQPWSVNLYVVSAHAPPSPPYLWSPTSLPLDICIRLNCACLKNLDAIWAMATPTQIRVLSLPNITDNEQFRPILTPFLRYRCPKLQTLKVKALGSTSMECLRPSLAAGLFPDLRHLEVDGIRRNMAMIYHNMFPIYKLLLKETIGTLESLTVSVDSDLVDDVPVFVNMVLEGHAGTLKTLRWLGSGGGYELHQRLDLEWFLYACPNLERVELSKDNNRYCLSGLAPIGTITIHDHSPCTLPTKTLPLLQKPSLPSTPWACTTTLTYLEISFRPSDEIKNEDEYRNQIESFYKKLGQLVALTELHLGCECRCKGQQLRTCLHSSCVEGLSSSILVAAECGNSKDSQGEDVVTDLLVKTSLQGQDNSEDRDQITGREKDSNSTITNSAHTTSSYSPTLDVSTPRLTPSPTTILDMSLATGLAHLSPLVNLKILNISRLFGHNIQVPELNWMKTHWSKSLKVFQGYKKSWIEAWCKDNWPELELRLCNSDYNSRRQGWDYYWPVVAQEE
ncbi:hypothetical protein EC991_005967 [Linnemannia zychae]|nr:hypothetical protein EC991_005967 [Linnemannia zychae]